MNNRYVVGLFGIIAFFLFSATSAADTSSVIVCGSEVADSGPFSWAEFSEGPGKSQLQRGDQAGTYTALQELLDEQSLSWPEDIRLPVLRSMQGLKTGLIKPTDFKITKDLTGIQARQYVFWSTADQLELPASAGNPACQPENAKQALLAVAQYSILVERSQAEILSEAFERAADVTQALEGAYDKYLYEGFPMYPWEAAVNSWFLTDKLIANGPPRNQLVLMHPAAGVLGAVGSGSDTDIDAVLSIEPVGWIHYADDYGSWYGASVITVFPSDRDAGIGVALNYNQFKLGVTWHDYDNDDYENPTIFLGLELYQFVGKEHRKYTAYKEKIKTISLDR